jgi:hypothetical protein
LVLFLIVQIRKYFAFRKRRASLNIPELLQLINAADDSLFSLLNELDTTSLPVELTNDIKVTCHGFQEVLSNASIQIRFKLELGTPDEYRNIASAINSINDEIAEQLHLMHNLVIKLRTHEENLDRSHLMDTNIILASDLLHESAANILNIYENIKEEFKHMSGNIKNASDENKPKSVEEPYWAKIDKGDNGAEDHMAKRPSSHHAKGFEEAAASAGGKRDSADLGSKGSMENSDPIRCRVAACRETLDDGKEWSFYLINDSNAPLDLAVLYDISYEWGNWVNSQVADVRVTGLTPGAHALI